MSNSISLMQRKLFNLFISYAQDYLKYKDIFTINLSNLLNEINSNNIKYLKEQIKELMSTVVDFNLLDKDKKTIWLASTLLSSVAFKN
jgi:hypothetical protein